VPGRESPTRQGVGETLTWSGRGVQVHVSHRVSFGAGPRNSHARQPIRLRPHGNDGREGGGRMYIGGGLLAIILIIILILWLT
jgi:hypothetical protein